MNRVARDVDDDADLDELMIRVRELALGTRTSDKAGTAVPAADEVSGCDADLLRVLDAQSEWNEHTRKALGEVVQCLQALRDDWIKAQKSLGDEIARLSARIRHLQPATEGALARRQLAPAARSRRTAASSRPAQARHAKKRGTPRS